MKYDAPSWEYPVVKLIPPLWEGVNIDLTSSVLFSSSLTTSGFGVIVVRLRFVRDLLDA